MALLILDSLLSDQSDQTRNMTQDIPIDEIQQDVRRALEEDIGSGDLTANLIPEVSQSEATVIIREDAVICGLTWFEQSFQLLDAGVNIHWQVADGEQVKANQTLCTLHGPARALLSGERTALNFLQTLSGTASRVRQYVDAVAGSGVEILDTRKTIPGMRRSQKYAVRCGGGHNHRMGLYDAVLIKENHIAAAGSIAAAIDKAHAMVKNIAASQPIIIEVEVENLLQLDEALAAGVDVVLLDNMANDTLGEAVALTQGRAKLEASGGVSLETIKAIAETGVDYISVGALTKDIQATDLSMRFNG